MLIGAGHHVGAPANDGFQRARAACEIADADVETFVLEVPEPLGNSEWQVVKGGLPSHGDMNIALLELGVSAKARKRNSHRNYGNSHVGPSSQRQFTRFRDVPAAPGKS